MHQLFLSHWFSNKFMNVIDEQAIAIAMDLAEAFHVIGFDRACQRAAKLGAAGHGDASIGPLVHPQGCHGSGQGGFSSSTRACQQDRRPLRQSGDRFRVHALEGTLVLRSSNKRIDDRIWTNQKAIGSLSQRWLHQADMAHGGLGFDGRHSNVVRKQC